MTDINYRSDVTVQLVKHSTADQDVVAAARVSTVGDRSLYDLYAETTTEVEARGLINFLMRERHGSPFEHNSLTFFVQAPIFVFREFQRHRTWSYNEESGRYRQLNPVFYTPGPDRKLVQIGKAGAYKFEQGDSHHYDIAQSATRAAYEAAWESYREMLDAGIAREVARTVLPVGLYSSMWATCNARSLMHFLSLRTEDEGARYPSHPQREIEMVAEEMEAHFARLMPITYEAFQKYGRVQP